MDTIAEELMMALSGRKMKVSFKEDALLAERLLSRAAYIKDRYDSELLADAYRYVIKRVEAERKKG